MLKRNATFLKVLIIIVVSLLFVLILGGGVKAADEVTWEGKDHDISGNDKVGTKISGTTDGVSWEIVVTKENVEIINPKRGEATLKIKSVNSSEVPENLVLPDAVHIKYVSDYKYSITKIEASSFTGVENVKSVQIGKYVTSIPNIETNSSDFFENFTSLTNIKVSEGNTKFESKDGALFTKGENMSVNAISYTDVVTLVRFPIAKDMRTFSFPSQAQGWQPWVIGDYAFNGNKTENVEIALGGNKLSIGKYAFKNCKGLKQIDISENDGIKEGVFEGCTSLEKVKLSSWIDSISDNAFKNCSSLKEITWDKYTGDEITRLSGGIGNKAFYGCTSLEQFGTIPDVYVSSIGDYAFFGCKKLKSIDLSQRISTIGEYAFNGCTSLEKISLCDEITSISKGTFGNCTSLAEVNLGNNLVEIGYCAFMGNAFKEIQLPDTLTHIDVYAFADCGNLEKINIPNTVAYIGGGAFSNCTNLSEVKLPENVDFVTIRDMLFAGCSSLKEINLPEQIRIIGQFSFESSGIEHIELPKNVTTINRAVFENCANLKNIVVYSNLNSIEEDLFNSCNMDELIVYCTPNNKIISYAPMYITYEINANNTVTLKDFNSTLKLNKLNLLSKIYGYPVTKIGDNAFEGDNYLTTVVIPTTVTEIGNSAFKSCTALTETFINKEITKIGNNAFNGCTNVNVLIEKDSQISTLGTDAFKNVKNIYYDGQNEVINAYVSNNKIVDTQGPSCTTMITAGTINATVVVTNIDDNDGSGAYKYVVTPKALTDITEDEWKEIQSNGFTETLTENGTYYIYIIDKIGNVLTKTLQITSIDETAPAIGDVTITGSKEGALITANITDEGASGLAYYVISTLEDSSKVTQWKAITGNSYDIEEKTSIIGDLYIHVKDAKGNVTSKKITINEKAVDTKAPTFGDITLQAHTVNNKTDYYDISIVLNDSGIGLAKYALDMNSEISQETKWVTIEKDEENYKATYTVAEKVYSNGDYYIHAEDAYGNQSSKKITIDGIVDLRAPSISIERDANIITIKLIDECAGIDSGAVVKYAWSTSATEEPKTAEYTQASLNYTKGDKEIKITIDASSKTGTYYLWVKTVTLKDVAGNVTTDTSHVSEAYIFDNTKPNYSITRNKSYAKNGDEIVYTINADEAIVLANKDDIKLSKGAELATIEKVEKDTEKDNIWRITVKVGEGDGVVDLTVLSTAFKDNSGNTLKSTHTLVNLYVDNTKPVFPANIETVIVKNLDQKEITFGFQEQIDLVASKINDITLTGDNSISGIIAKTELDSESKNLKITIIGGLGTGDVKLNIPEGLIKDKAGNENDGVSITGIKFDNTESTLRVIEPTGEVTPDETNKVVYKINADKKVTLNDKTKIVISPNTITGKIDVIPVNAEDLTQGYYITISDITGKGDAIVIINSGAFVDDIGNNNKQLEIEGLKVNNQAVTGVTLNESSLSIRDGETTQLTATVLPEDATNKNVTWESSDNTIATVDETGKVTSVKPGTVTITVKTVSGEKTATCTVEITAIPVENITLDHTELTVEGAKTQKLVATVTPANASNKKVLWTSSDNTIATVDEEGNVTTLKDGTVTITAKTEDGEKTATCVITVKPVAAIGITLDKKELSTYEEIETKLIPTITPAEATNRKINWVSSDPSVVTVDSEGTVKGIKAGTATITATIEGTELKATSTVTVTAKALTEIEIATLPAKTEYIVGQNFDKTGMVVTAKYNNGTTKEVSDYIVKDGDNLQKTKTAVTISYTENGVEKTKDLPISVIEEGYRGIKFFNDYPIGSVEEQYVINNQKEFILELTNIPKEEKENIEFAVSDTTKATIQNVNLRNKEDGSEDGIIGVNVNFIAVGKVTINAKLNYKGIEYTASKTINIKEKLESIYKFEDIKGETSVEVGKTTQLTTSLWKGIVPASEEESAKIIWESSKPEILTVDTKGLVTGVKEGTATVTVKYNDETVGQVVEKTIEIIVTTPETPLIVTSEKYLVDNTNKIIKGINPLTKESDFYKDLTITGDNVEKSLDTVTTSGNITTGMKLTIKQDGEEKITYTLVVKGDVNGDGEVTIRDILDIARDLAGVKQLSEISKIAGDLTSDGKTNIKDIVVVARVIAGIVNI